MTADTEPLDASELRKRAVALRAFIDQDPEDTDEDGDPAVVTRVYTQDELDAIGEHHPRIATALDRVEADYSKLCQASTDLEASQDALDALVIVETLQQEAEDAEAEEEPSDDEPFDGDGEDHSAPDEPDDEHDPEDPDADLDEEE